MKTFVNLFVVLGTLLFVTGCPKASKPVERTDLNVELLLERMADVRSFALPPLGDSFLESSYDRTGANQDWAIYTKAGENGRIKILDVDGPGYISRMWIASYYAKRWFFFIDGETEARLVLTKEELFGGRFPFVEPLAGLSGGGRYSLMPILFRDGIRIEIEPENLKPANRNYFQINYTRLDPHAFNVESLPAVLSAQQHAAVEKAVSALSDGREVMRERVSSLLGPVETVSELQPGASLSFWEDDGAGLLQEFALRVEKPDGGAALSSELLRNLRLQCFWDGNTEPSVDVPLGDFFCNAFYTREFGSLPLGRVDDTFICRFPMPYAEGAHCRILNTAKVPVSLRAGTAGNRNTSEGLERTFHAAWSASARSGAPLQFVKTAGAGHYLGCYLTAIGQDGTWTILEGDEVLYPDVGRQNVQHGTGLEDYFNGAYYYTSLFDLPFHGLIEKGAMRTDQYRLHQLDAVRFQDTFRAEIEFGDRHMAKGYMSCLSYWYQDQATAFPLSESQESLLARPADRFELHGLMTQLFLLERDGLYHDAADRMAFFVDRFQDQPWVDLLKVRELGYRERADGFETVKAELESLSTSEFPAAARAASDLLWLHAEEGRALLGVHTLSKFQLKLDGNVVASGEGKNDLQVWRLEVAGEDHAWTADLQPTRQGSFFSLCLRTVDGDIRSTGDWQVKSMALEPGRKRVETVTGGAALPNMTLWAFDLNGFIEMQSPAMGIVLWSFWDSKPRFRRIVIEQDWSFADQIGRGTDEMERSDGELRANAIN